MKLSTKSNRKLAHPPNTILGFSRRVPPTNSTPSAATAAAFLLTHKRENTVTIRAACGSGKCKLVIPRRSPSITLTKPFTLTHPPPGGQPRPDWTPEIGIGIVSETSIQRDHVEKCEDYYLRGCKEHEVLGPSRAAVFPLNRSPLVWQEQTFGPPAAPQTRLLPSLSIATTTLLRQPPGAA